MENIIKFFNDITFSVNEWFLGVTKDIEPDTLNMLIWLVGLAVFITILKIIVSSGYQTQFMILRGRIKNKKLVPDSIGETPVVSEEIIVTPEDEKNSKKAKKEKEAREKKENKFGVVSKAMNDYKSNLDKGVVNIDTKSIINKYLYKLSFLGWAFPSIERFILGAEVGIIFAGLMFAMFFNEKSLYALTTISIFFALKVFGSIFDYNLVRDKLVVEMEEYIEKEFAVLNSSDLDSSISKFRKELYTAIIKQGDTLNNAIEKLGSNLTGALALSISDMSKAVEESINEASRFTDSLEKPLNIWSDSINNATVAQEKINAAYNSLSGMVNSLNESSNSLTQNYDLYFNKMDEHVGSFKDEISVLSSAITEVKIMNETNKVDYEAINRELSYIDKNQITLEQSLRQYEAALESVTSQVGDALGNIVELQMQNSYQKMNLVLQDNIDTIIGTNNDVLLKMQDLFEEMQEQTRVQTQAVVRVKEQMDMQFDVIREKI